jgi:poly-gamma-glutamate synthesis protein (capsule biosynthesis protein)
MTDRRAGPTLAAVGDVVLLRPPREDLFRVGWDDADLRIANLEAPLAEAGVPAPKLIRLKSPPAAAGWLADGLHCDAVSLANNHALDWGEPGLVSTLSSLDAAGIEHAGAGPSAHEAGRHRVLGVGGTRIGFLSWACTIPPGFLAREGGAGLAGVRVRTSYAADPFLIDEQPGTPPWVHTEAWAEDVEALAAAIGRARAETDLVVLALHWGVPPQWSSRFQGPLAEYQPALGARLVGAGADLILGHHAHTVYGLEQVSRPDGGVGLICYSLGNYIFHPYTNRIERSLDQPSRPYHTEELIENRETYVARFALQEDGGGRLTVAQARLYPAILRDSWEAARPEPHEAQRIADRVTRFSTWRDTPTTVEDGAVVWRRRPRGAST